MKTLSLLISVILAGLADAQTAPSPYGWPIWTHKGEVKPKSSLVYNPTNEIIFPALFNAGAYLANPLGQWYMYYAPHDAPGGVALMYADSIEGPWTEYENNPVISNQWGDYYNVSHVSSPHPIWNNEAGRVFVYFHGENNVTRWAETDNGYDFDYGGAAVTNRMGGPRVTESSYARVFTHTNPLSKYKYAMFYMANEVDGRRRIRLAESIDGRAWTVSPKRVLWGGTEEGHSLSGANLIKYRNVLYLIYHGSSGKIYARSVDRTLRKINATPIVLYSASGEATDIGRSAAPHMVRANGKWYLFYESGARSQTTIMWAKANTCYLTKCV
ncbi:hypothetical protein FZEAL_7688 [Fusarium zealandicum]|uniref:Uncharacterized protein n=1 Tax=Fusarium zealandicum TaxID=1053134 RepID=A0A8H4XHM0_9HYPO|nr:hypothetical protein FZEAL_7688 [Fusarium zealandicum]